MQNSKDTFYITLQSRLATLNPARTIVLRNVVRPGVLVDENELSTASIPVDAFRLEWSALLVDTHAALPLATMECIIRYATDGTSGNAGMDRGRLLSAMDAELASALAVDPESAPKLNYAAAGPGIAPTTMGTTIFWMPPVFAPATTEDGRLGRTVTVQVYAFQELGEL